MPNIDLSPEKEKDILRLVLANKSESEQYLRSSGYTDEWREWYDMYRSVPDSKPEKWMSNVFIPTTHPKVESALTNLMGMLFSQKPPVEVRPRPFTGGDEKHAGIIKTILAKRMEDADYFMKFMQFLKGILIYGISFAKVCVEYKEQKVKIKTKQYEPLVSVFGLNIGSRFSGYGAEEKNIVSKDSPVLEPLNIYDCFYDPLAKCIEESWFIHRTYRTRDYLKKNMKSESNPYGVYNDNVNNIKKEDGTSQRTDRNQIEGSLNRQDMASVTNADGAERIELLERLGEYDINDDGKLEDCILTVACGKYVIRAEEMPLYYIQKPVVAGTYIPLINEIPGIGIPELIADLQHLLNENVNQRNDNIAFVLNAEKLYKKNSGINLQKLKSRPGQMTGVDDMNDVTYTRPPDVTQGNFMHCGEIERWMQEATSITRMTLGVGGVSGGKTATAASIMEGNVEERFLMIAKIIENMAFNKIAQMFYQIDYQFLDEQQMSELSGIDVTDIDIEKMRPDFYVFEPAGVRSMQEKNTKTLKLLQLLNIADRYPFVDKEAILKKIFALMNISDNPNEFFYSDEKMAQMMMQAQSMGLPPFFGNGMEQGKMGGGSNESTRFNGTQIQTPGVPPTAETNVAPDNMKV